MSRTADQARGAVSLRHLGAALGASSGPVAAFGQSWSGIGDGRVHVWILATLVGALLGAVAFPIFWPRRDDAAAPREQAANVFSVGFAALFGFSVGLVAGAFVAFPMGAVMGALGGAVAGGVASLLARRLAFVRGGLVLASAGGAGVALLGAWAWVQ